MGENPSDFKMNILTKTSEMGANPSESKMNIYFPTKENTYQFNFDEGIDTNNDYRERYQILINGKNSNKFLIISTEKNNGITDPSPQLQKYELLVQSNINPKEKYSIEYTEYLKPHLQYESIVKIINYLNN